VFLQQGDELILKASLSMMFFLPLNIPRGRGDQRGTYAEGGVTLLPGKFPALRVSPFGRIGFYGLDGLGDSHHRRNLEEKMDMVPEAPRLRGRECRYSRRCPLCKCEISIETLEELVFAGIWY
jgi:hypothetical protein